MLVAYSRALLVTDKNECSNLQLETPILSSSRKPKAQKSRQEKVGSLRKGAVTVSHVEHGRLGVLQQGIQLYGHEPESFR